MNDTSVWYDTSANLILDAAAQHSRMETVARLLGLVIGPALLHLPSRLLAASPRLCVLAAYGLKRHHRRLVIAKAKELKKRLTQR